MQAKRGFTLIELLVVIAIIAVLAAILFPVFSQARERARVATCISNARQIGLAVRMYVQDYDETFPIFHAYNSQPPAGQPGHLGVEVSLEPYTKNKPIFKCPSDTGSPYQQRDVPGTNSYWQAYGSSYRFTHCCYTVICGFSTQNNLEVCSNFGYQQKIVTDASFVNPAQTRIMRDEMFPFFSRNVPGYEKYGYDFDAPWDYFRMWHPQGGSLIFADGHAKFVASSKEFDETLVSPEGLPSGGGSYPNENYWLCD